MFFLFEALLVIPRTLRPSPPKGDQKDLDLSLFVIFFGANLESRTLTVDVVENKIAF